MCAFVKEAHVIKLEILWEAWLIQNLECFFTYYDLAMGDSCKLMLQLLKLTSNWSLQIHTFRVKYCTEVFYGNLHFYIT